MPWNDNIKPGPWGSGGSGGGSPGGGDGDGPDDGDKSPAKEPGPRKGPWAGAGDRGPRRPRNSGPDGGGPRRPLGGPGGPGFKGPDLQELSAQLRERFDRMFGGSGGGGRVGLGAVAAVAGIGAALWALSGLYIVQPDQEAVITRFGAFARSEGPGLRYRLPSPVERVEKVSVTALNRLDVGGGGGTDIPEESLMLTGDENIVDLNFSVQWRINDAANYLFNVTDPDATVKMVAESAMREVVGKTPLQAILTTGRGQVQQQSADLMQRILDNYGSGVSIVEVQIRTANPPAEVIAAFREVANAGQDAEAAVNEANTYRNRVINEAKGDASKIVQSAQGYREKVVREATGDASRFSQIDAEYRRAPAITRERLYLETMEQVLKRSPKVVIDTKGGTAPIVLPPDLLRPRTSQDAQAQVQPQPQPQVQAPATDPSQANGGVGR